MENPLAKLKLDYWYKVVILIAFSVFLANGGGYLKEYPTIPTALISLGSMFIGLGEWKNHPLQTVVYSHGVGSSHPRKFSFIGSVFVFVGSILCWMGLRELIG